MRWPYQVRRKLASEPGWERSEAVGVPINQEDMAVTLLSFSYNVLAGLEKIRGKPVSSREQQVWCYI